ncbi:MAG: hypothetical protein IJI37_03320 [Opitutales bacterium]|nr:hypothetical protein [Opitutales bacterium]
MAAASAQDAQPQQQAPAQGAQPQQAPAPDAEETVDVTLKIFRWAFSNSLVIPDLGGDGKRTRKIDNSDGVVDLWYKSGGSYVRLNLSSGEMSKPIRYKGPKTMVLYSRREMLKTEEDKSSETQYEYKEACRMSIPLGIDEMFALMFKTGKSVRFYPMNVSPKRLPKDKIAVINMTSHNVAVLVGGHAQVIRSGSNSIFAPKNKKENFVEFQIARMVDKQWRPVYKNNISTPKNERCLILLYDPYNKRSPKFSVQLLTL